MSALHRLRVARYLGTFGAVMVAVAAYLGGALPDGDLLSTPTRILATPVGPYCLAAWLVGTALMVAAWLLAGRAGPLPARWVLVTAALWVLPLALAPPLGSRDVYAYACQGAVYLGGLNPYQVGPDALPCPWIDTMSYIWRDTPAPYGPLYLAATAGAVKISGGHLWVVLGLLRLMAVVGVGVATTYLRRLAQACGVDDARATWLALAAPVTGIHLVSGGHNDALMIGFCLAGLVYAARRHPLAAGALIGLAVAVKATAGIALPFAVLLAVRPDRSWRRLCGAAAWAALGFAVTYGAIALVTGLGVGWLAGLRYSGETVQWTSVPTGVGMAVGYVGRLFGDRHLYRGAVDASRTAALAVLAVVLVATWWRARGRDARQTVGYAGGALLVATMLAPVFHPWYWLLPITVLAAAGVAARWAVAVTAALAFLVLPDGYSLARAIQAPGAFAALAAAIAAVVWWGRRYLTGRRLAPAGAAAPAHDVSGVEAGVPPTAESAPVPPVER
ncbi:polyprenol phosphomannose-dependent alpha 1,6 mannosyltransferase MptB [Planosporangium sp. 12N6]|uniref:polyprenol phosphomannose-dependent alpha 1,6 mannosyltransferase MptB n=1 Tax=Planosporangium spinosum TaxID=3402278 RepID=UPI003CE9B787